jgi:CHAD domain
MTMEFDPAGTLDAEIRRLAGPEIEKAVAELSSADLDPAKAVHRARKQLKWMRALLALVRPADAGFFKTENGRYRDIGRSLARPRTAAACVEAIDRFMHDYPKQCERNNVGRLRSLMAARVLGNDAMEGFDAAVNAAVASCAAGLAVLAKFRTGGDRDKDAEVLCVAVDKNLKRMARSLEAADRHGRADDFHELRKAVKAHAVHVDLLAAVWPERRAGYVKSLAKLGQSLGDLHDITMVRTHLPEHVDAEIQKAMDCLLKLMRRKEKKLRKRCVAKARQLLPDRPKKVANAVATHWLQAAEARLAA